MEAAQGGADAALTPRRKQLVLAAAILGTTVVTVDSTVANVALPAIADDLGGGLAGQQWTANAYLVTLSALLLIGGSLGDIFGERRVFALGVFLFGATSLICALAPTIEVLVGARALQGVAGALLTPAALAVIVSTFPPEERGKAVGAWTAWGGIGTVLGPVIGGQLVDAASWRWIFAINVPIVLITIVLILRVVPVGRERDPNARVDVVGAALCAFGLAGITFGLIEQPLHGWTDVAVALPLVAGAVLFVCFLVWEARSAHPMLPLALFRRRNFAAGNLETFLMYGGLGLLFFFLVLFLQQVAGFSALEAGSASIPVTLLMFGLSMRFGALADKHGPRFFMGVGPLVAAVGMLLLMMRVDADAEYVTDVLPGLLVFGFGLSMTVAPLTATVLADADDSNAGIASGVNNAIARVAGLVAIAAVGAVVAASFGVEAGRRGGAAGAGAARGGAGGGRGEETATGGGGCPGRAGGRGGVGARVGRGRVGGGVPRGPRDSHRAGGAGRGAGADRDHQPAPEGGGRRLPGRAARGPAARGERGSRRATGAQEARWRSALPTGQGPQLERPDEHRRREPPSTGALSSASAPPARSSWRCRRRRRAPQARRPRPAGRRSRPGPVPGHAGLQLGAARLQHALRRRPPAGGRPGARHARRPGRRPLGQPLRRPHGGSLGRAQLRGLLDDRRRRGRRPQPPARDRRVERPGDRRARARS